ncbi:hypothetical protein TWF481_002427 [Arthrobotrys musiformis]|uniref:Uncharacterized protein n=1 Tax=Arthrobotrys musiformis TaxID=47236 RepID=A0AAV9VT44_9PEZI
MEKPPMGLKRSHAIRIPPGRPRPRPGLRLQLSNTGYDEPTSYKESVNIYPVRKRHPHPFLEVFHLPRRHLTYEKLPDESRRHLIFEKPREGYTPPTPRPLHAEEEEGRRNTRNNDITNDAGNNNNNKQEKSSKFRLVRRFFKRESKGYFSKKARGFLGQMKRVKTKCGHWLSVPFRARRGFIHLGG